MLQTKGNEHLHPLQQTKTKISLSVLMVFLCIEDKEQCPNVGHFPAA